MKCKSCGDSFIPYKCDACGEHPVHCRECHAELRHGFIPPINAKNMVKIPGRGLQVAVSGFYRK